MYHVILHVSRVKLKLLSDVFIRGHVKLHVSRVKLTVDMILMLLGLEIYRNKISITISVFDRPLSGLF